MQSEHTRYGVKSCDVCSEDIHDDTEDVAEMYNATQPGSGSIICHYSCGQGIGYDLA